MLEILAFANLMLLLALAAGAAIAFLMVRGILKEILAGLIEEILAGLIRISQSQITLAEAQTQFVDMLREAIANLPKKGKPGRKPSSSTGAKRGPKPKAPATEAPAALFPVPAPSNIREELQRMAGIAPQQSE